MLRGRPDRYKREDNVSTPHLQIRVLEDGGQPWRIAVNVQSDTGSTSRSGSSTRSPAIHFWRRFPRASGFSTVAGNAGNALDYVKAPLFDWAHGRALPPSGSASADDLQDLLSLYLDQCKAAGGEIYAFGAKFDQNLHKPIDTEFGNLDGLHGIHDIHLNQGNVGRTPATTACSTTAGSSSRSPIVISVSSSASRRSASRGHAGNAAPGAIPSARSSPGSRYPRRCHPAVYIERALINPSGPDPGHEVVVLANLSTTAQTLSNWRLLDKNARVTAINTTLGSGQSVAIALDGSGVQLGTRVAI